MKPFLVTSVVKAILNLKRTCPKCKKDQIVARSRRNETVLCKCCGGDIPPAKAH